ncbi:MAG: nickel transporter permease [Bacillota bacterium]|uniref:nickel transporter permease n=1 Tax=Desulforudis sp. DRI-14 TaxID=3459793 RepID=UPI0034812DA9
MHETVTVFRTAFSLARLLQGIGRDRASFAGGVVVILLVLVALLAPWLAPHDPVKQNLAHALAPPGGEYPLGTDDMGRCLLSRVLYGTRISLAVGLLVGGLAAVAGTLIGLIAGYYGGFLDEVLMRLTDVLMGLPNLVFILAVVGVLGPGLGNTILALVALGWLHFARVVRGSVLSLKESEFVLAARALGFSGPRIMVRHILPNVLGPVVVLATFDIPHTILAVAGLSFLGLGAQPPTPEWGAMLNAARSYMRTYPLLMITPGLMIFLTVLAFNLVGNGLRDALDPRRSRILDGGGG